MELQRMLSCLAGAAIAVVVAGFPALAASYAPMPQSAEAAAATDGSNLDPAIEPNQHARVDIMDPLAPVDSTTSGVLQNAFITMPGDPGDSDNPATGYATISVFVPGNRTVRLRFAEVDNQFFFNFGVDKCSLNVAGIGDVLVNGSFESNGGAGTNSFTGWTVYNVTLGSPGDFFVQTGATSPLNAFPVPVPTDGAFAAMTDQLGAGLHILYQDVFIPAAGAQLTCDLFVGSQAPFAIAAVPPPNLAPAPALTPFGLVALTAVLLWLSRRSMRASALR